MNNLVVHAICFIVASSYVVSLYLIPKDIRKLPRENPLHIKYRMIFSSASTMISIVSVYFLYKHDKVILSGQSFSDSIGLSLRTTFPSILLSFFLMMIFYMGPITVQMALFLLNILYDVRNDGRLMPLAHGTTYLSSMYKAIQTEILKIYVTFNILDTTLFRNLIFAPVTEELVFRAIVVPVMFSYYCKQNEIYTPFQLAMLSPSWFALAHAHHVYDKLRMGMPFKYVIIQTLVQLSYTTIFGIIAALLLMRTNSIAGSIVSHIICNFYGLPSLEFLIPPCTEESRSMSCLFPYRYAILVLHAAGLIIFAYVMFPLTEKYALHSPLWYN